MTLASPHSVEQRQGWPPPGSWRNSVGRDSQACQSSGAALWRQSIKCPYARAGTGACGDAGKARAGALERSGPRPRGCSALERGGPRSRGRPESPSEAESARGGVRASSEADLARGSDYPSSEADFTQGASAVLSWRAAGATRVVIALCMCFRCASLFVFAFFAGFKRVSPRLFRGPLGLSPTVALEHLWVFLLGPRRCWSLLIGRSSLLVANAVPWGCVSGPAGLAPEALHERECSCRGFFASFYQCARHLFQPASTMFQPASVARA
jgi:hypothetical protein